MWLGPWQSVCLREASSYRRCLLAEVLLYMFSKKVLLDLLTGIEANDVGALLEQFLEYEEKQGTVCAIL